MAINRKATRQRIHERIRKKVSGTAERPRLAVHFSGRHVYAQVIDDDAGKTLAAVSTLQKDLAGKKTAANRESAERVGKAIAEKLLAKKVENIVFDRGGYIFHGKVKALADAARETPAARGDTTEKVVFINRCAKVVKGGRRFSFSALIVAGDHDGKVGVGFGKANEVAEAIRKASEAARKSMEKVSLHENTIPHETIGEFGGGRVLLRPASPGTGVIAGGGVRAVVEAAGIRDVLAKSLGSSNHSNVVKATIEALRNLRRRDEILKVRGIRPRVNSPADGGQQS
jgi:small subunit ribosomal protein S5